MKLRPDFLRPGDSVKVWTDQVLVAGYGGVSAYDDRWQPACFKTRVADPSLTPDKRVNLVNGNSPIPMVVEIGAIKPTFLTLTRQAVRCLSDIKTR